MSMSGHTVYKNSDIGNISAMVVDVIEKRAFAGYLYYGWGMMINARELHEIPGSKKQVQHSLIFRKSG
jgi:hypothetical protein